MKSKRTDGLITDGLALVEQKYGLQSSDYLAYHNTEHTNDVMRAAEAIGHAAQLQGKITELDVELLILAACYHDAEHGMHGSDNEHESIHIVTKKMFDSGAFTEHEIAKIEALIKATIVLSSTDGIIQSATNDYATQILADADLSNFGKPFKEFWDRSKKYQLEYSKVPFEELNKAAQGKFITSQIKVLQKHTYYTPEANEIFGHKLQNIEYLKNM
jgi:predicted metal-dependent HD superfamily phosphohydrolase